MKRRFITSLVAGVVYATTYAVIVWQRGDTVDIGELVLGGVLFFLAFFAVRSWLDNRRNPANNSSYEKENQKDLSA
jgi:hypothetical protein